MTALPQVASVHPATVTAYSEGERRFPRPRLVHGHSSPVTTTIVHPDLWAYALAVTGGDCSRIEVHGCLSITIHNTGRWRTEHH